MRWSGLFLSPLPGKSGNQLDLPPAELMCQSPIRFKFSAVKEFPKQNGILKKPVFMDFLKKWNCLDLARVRSGDVDP